MLSPHFTILPSAQRRLWPDLRSAPRLGFTLYGGTAIALRLGHRHSVDFDFFSDKALGREAIKNAFPFMHGPVKVTRSRSASITERLRRAQAMEWVARHGGGTAFWGEFLPKRRERGERLRRGDPARALGLLALGALQTQHR